jgi:predicted metal-dependent peptidase
MDTKERIDLTFSKLGLREPFIAAVMTKVKRVISDTIPTAGTDGITIFYNPDFADKQNERQLFGLTLHEALHIILLHPWRRGDRDHKLWNIANDAIINSYIKKRGYFLPEGAVFIDWVTEDMSSEYVYDRLKQDQQQDSDSGQGAGGFDGEGDLFDAPSDATLADLEATIIASAQAAKECGHGSGLIDSILKNVGTPKVDWRNETRAMLTSSMAADYTYARFSRRFIGQGMYMPSLHSEALGGIVIGIDSSGSMTQDELNQTASEVQSIFDDLSPEFVEVVFCDTDVRSVRRFERGKDIELKLAGGGGTRFKPVFDHVLGMSDVVHGVIYFTDMEGDLKECPDPNMPVIWANTGHHQKINVPFGVVANVEI